MSLSTVSAITTSLIPSPRSPFSPTTTTSSSGSSTILDSLPFAQKQSLLLRCSESTSYVPNHTTPRPSSGGFDYTLPPKRMIPTASFTSASNVISDPRTFTKVNFLHHIGAWTWSDQSVHNFDANIDSNFPPLMAVIAPRTFEHFSILSNPSKYTPKPPCIESKADDTASVKSGSSFSYSYSFSSPPIPNSRSPSPSPGFINICNPYSSNSSNSSNNTSDTSRPLKTPGMHLSIQNMQNAQNVQNSQSVQNKTNRLGCFKDYVFFSTRLTSELRRKMGANAADVQAEALYQFEARKFQFSLLRGDIRFVRDYRGSSRRVAKAANVTNMGNIANIRNNLKLEANGATDYLIFKFGRDGTRGPLYGICERNDRPQQPWCCQYIKNLTQMIDFFKIGHMGPNVTKQFLQVMKIDDKIENKVFDPEIECRTNWNKINRILVAGLRQYRDGCQRRAKRNFKRRKGLKGDKLKNEAKFGYLSRIASCLGLTVEDIVPMLEEAIGDAFAFARKYPKSVMTQAYIDEERRKLSFENVLEAEIYDDVRGCYYKFAVPVVRVGSKNNATGRCYYEARNILTPKMALDNVRLNSRGAALDPRVWVVQLGQWQTSLYRALDAKWFENTCRTRTSSYVEHVKHGAACVASHTSALKSDLNDLNRLSGLGPLRPLGAFNVWSGVQPIGNAGEHVNASGVGGFQSCESNNKARATPRNGESVCTRVGQTSFEFANFDASGSATASVLPAARPGIMTRASMERSCSE